MALFCDGLFMRRAIGAAVLLLLMQGCDILTSLNDVVFEAEPESCDPAATSAPVADTCGVFVSASAKAGGDGTRGKAFSTLGDAINSAKESGVRRLYVCSETFIEAVELPAQFTVYGGLECTKNWAFSPTARTTIAPDSGIPMTFGPGGVTHVQNVRAEAPAGTPPDDSPDNPRSGGSSIAALALPESNVELVRCELEAGAGADGIAADGNMPLGASPGGKDGDAACASGEGAAAVAHTCSDPSGPGGQVDASGGRGGDGEGTPGLLPAAPGAGDAGGEAGVTQTIAVTQCSEGGTGDNGADGAAGQGGQSMSTTLLDDAYKAAPGEDGKHGVSGGGGGGGGGGKACSGGPGSGGGSGGGGGCGGAGGKGGGAGGSSIALFAADATISLDQVSLKAGAAGKGAPGAAGQKGALGGGGGQGGSQVGGEDSVACRGGAGGKGGDGGPGGGGQGGHSIAAVWRTVPPTATKATFTAGTPGVGAAGGTGAGATGTGANGLACQALDIALGKCVTP